MSTEQHINQQEFPALESQSIAPERSAKDVHWESVEIDGEKYEVMRGLTDITTTKDGEKIAFAVEQYRHPETGMDITLYNIGMNRPKNEPAPIRADYSCPCMNFGPNFSLVGHDCAEQRGLMFDTIANLGIGVMAVVANDAAAGNGHGSDAVHRQSTFQHEAMQKGEHVPSMEETYAMMGHHGDIRRHDIVAKLIATALDGRPAISTTSNKEKMQDFQQAGINVILDTRIELITSQSQNRQSHIGERRGAAYEHVGEHVEPGAYLVNGEHVRLTPDVYRERLINKPIQTSSRRRLPN